MGDIIGTGDVLGIGMGDGIGIGMGGRVVIS